MPFVGVAALALAGTLLRTAGTDWMLVAVAAAVATPFAGVALALPWNHLPRSALVVLPIACDALIAILRQAQGGNASGYAPLLILPVVWVGLTQRTPAVAVIAASTCLTLGLPIALIGGSAYPADGWRSVVFWGVVSLVVGISSNRIAVERRTQTALSEARANELDELFATQTALATAKFDLQVVLNTVVTEALTLANADGAVVELPDRREMVIRAAAGTAKSQLVLRLEATQTLSGKCLATGRPLQSDDTDTDSRVDQAACCRIGARSLMLVPLVFDGRTTGVLKVYANRVCAFDDSHLRLLGLLANMIGGALARAELVEKLREQSITDELTGLTNRRAWYDQLHRAVARASRTSQPLSVLVLDIDGLKSVNDDRSHAAGDRLIKSLTSIWSRVLRETDLLGRLGGDEFAVILENTSMVAAGEIAERLESLHSPGSSASIGVAEWDGREPVSAALARADVMMYERKRWLDTHGDIL